MKKIILPIALTLVLLPQYSMAVLDYYVTATYWSTCWKNVTAEEFTASALKDIEEIRIVHNMKYNVPIMNQDNSNTNDMLKIVQKSSEAVIGTLNNSYQSMSEARSTLRRNFLKEKLNYLRALEENGLNEEEYGFFNDGNGIDGVVNKNTQSYSHYKNLCKRNKMFAKVASPEFNISKSSSIGKTVQKATLSATQNTSIASQAKSKIESHFKKWCSKEEIIKGLCDTNELSACDSESGVCKDGDEFKLANADIDSTNVINPFGFKDRNAIVDELFETKYTYDEDQEEAARDFAYNIIYAGSIPAPTVKEKEDPSKSEFVQAYQNHLSSLNLAHFTYTSILEMRKPVNEDADAEEIVVSELDIIHYILHNMKNPDNLSTIMAGKEKGIDLATFIMMTLKNKLEFYKYEQNQRIEGLLAAILTQEATSPTNFVYSNKELKK